nr:putative reverse transcriptase domain-containing protein [Tanacetum cinerariifolium]
MLQSPPVKRALSSKLNVTPPNGAWTKYVSGGVTLLRISSTKHKERPLRKQEEKRIEEEQVANARYWKIPAYCDDDDDYNSAITPILSTEEPKNSLSMGDEHLDTIPATKSDEVIKSSVEDLVPIPSEFEGTPDTMCDVHLANNPTPLEAKYHFKIVTKSNDDISSSDDDSLYNENIEYVEASPHDSEVVSLEVAGIVIPEEEEIEDDNLREKLLNVQLLIANIEALKDNPTSSSKSLTKSSSTSPKSFLEETNTFHNSFPEFENFCFDLKEISSGIEDDHSPLLAYVVWIFLAYLTYLVVPPCLHSFGNEDTIFDPGITINHVYSFKPDLSHRCGAFKKFNTHRSHLNEWPMIINGKNTPILDKYLADANLHAHLKEIKVDKTLRFVEEPVEIINCEVKSLKRSRIPIVKLIGIRSEKYLADANLHAHLKEIKVDKTLRFVEEPVEIINCEVKSLKRSRIPIVKLIGIRSEVMRIS